MEVPEIAEGIVDIKAVARDAGVRSKIAVYSADSDVDPVGACVGMKGSRVQSVVQELRGEKIDIVLWDQDHARFVCNAIAPAQVNKVIVLDAKHSIEVIVPDDQLSLAIGRKGQNVRLAANLMGWNIDVYSESKVEDMAKFAKAKLVDLLGVSESIATLLYANAFRSIQEIVDTPEEEFTSIPGMDGEMLKEVYTKAEEAYESGQSDEYDETKAKEQVELAEKEALAKEKAEAEEKAAEAAKAEAVAQASEEAKEASTEEAGEESAESESTKAS